MLLKGVKDEIEVRVTAVVEVDNGAEVKVPFRAKYKKPVVDEAAKILKDIDEGVETDQSLMEKYLIGWRELKDANDEPIDFSPEAREVLMRHREYRQALVDGFLEVILGRGMARRKNSSRPGTRSA